MVSCSALAVEPTVVTPGYSAITCSAGVTGCAFAGDGSFPPEGQWWQNQTAWWNGTELSVVYMLDASYLLTGLRVSLDNNDSYRIDTSLDGSDWESLTSVAANAGEIGFGMDTFTTDPADSEYLAALAFAPTSAWYVRILATGGDNQYAVGELQLVAAVPEPGTAALWLGGLAGLGWLIRRRRA
jgi:hypothetical protein